MTDLASFLHETIDRELPNLRAVTEERSAVPRGAGKWSPKEELGHLIDSASNNHLRFVGGATMPEYRGPGYAQEEWVRLHGYAEMPWEEIVALWYRYNKLLARVVAATPAGQMSVPCTVGAEATMQLGNLIDSYVLHMQHHIDQLLLRETITKYPRA